MDDGLRFSQGFIATKMNITINPFQQLYFSDDTQSEDNFVQLFSDEVLQAAIHPVFQGGNVVLSGTQGCGKTMILNLLRPEIRIAYWSRGRAKEYPVNETMRDFVSAGINLTRSRITDIGQATLGRGEETDIRELPLYFSDFFNYLVVHDLLKSIETIGKNQDVFGGLVNTSRINQFVEMLASQDCWFKAIANVKSIEDLNENIARRIDIYRLWVNGNIEEIDVAIGRTKTNIGEPIARAAECLRDCGVIASSTPVLIRVDQIEEMHRAFTDRSRRLLLAFRKMLNRVFAARDARVHYRAGSRRHGWDNPEFLGIWGSEARLELRRDYHLIDMDEELFKRGEMKNSVFERFAIDAFQKRVAYYSDGALKLKPQLAKSVFGRNPKATDRIRQLNESVTDTQIDRALALDSSLDPGYWSPEWLKYLRKLYRSGHDGMLDAALAAAWGRQTGGANSKVQHRSLPPPDDTPWSSKTWWRKERLDQAVLQLTSRNQQRVTWWGYKDICSLSGGNILVFLHICHRIWDGFLKSETSLPDEERTDLFNGKSIDRHIQSAGILLASNEWFKKLLEEPGGNSRQAFVEQLGIRLNCSMMNDLSMSYPGGNGISFPLAKFMEQSDDVSRVRDFVREAVGFGALFESEHSSKSKQGGRRIKFYLNPILCPRFQLPEARTKEPYYWSIEELNDLLAKANVTLPRVHRVRNKPLKNTYYLPGMEDTHS
jgi:hypothetical protein